MPETKDDLSYLEVGDQDKKVLKNLADMGERLKTLRLNMLNKEAEYEQSKKEYEHFANVILPQEMFSVGLTSLTLANGGQINVQHKYYCQPNKNDEDRKVMSDWLRKNQGEHLIKSVANVFNIDILISVFLPNFLLANLVQPPCLFLWVFPFFIFNLEFLFFLWSKI